MKTILALSMSLLLSTLGAVTQKWLRYDPVPNFKPLHENLKHEIGRSNILSVPDFPVYQSRLLFDLLINPSIDSVHNLNDKVLVMVEGLY